MHIMGTVNVHTTHLFIMYRNWEIVIIVIHSTYSEVAHGDDNGDVGNVDKWKQASLNEMYLYELLWQSNDN